MNATDHGFTDADIEALKDTVRRFATEQVRPHVDAWDAAGEFPRALYRQAAALGLLGLGYPEHLGGTPAPWRARNALSQTLARHGGSGGVMASLFSLNIGLPPVLAHGSPELQAEVVPPVLRGERIAALAITEPGGGSDVASLRCTARRDGGDYVIHGEKVFITSGMRADWITLAVRTDLASKGASGISMILVPGDAAGLSCSPLQKMGWHCSDTAQLRFDGVRVPARCLLGEEGAGFRIIMGNFNGERLAMSAMALGFAQACWDEALAWARQRQTFGAPLIERQVIRHRLMDMQMRIGSTQAWVDTLTAQADAAEGAVPPPGRPKAEQPPWGAATHAQQGSVGAHSAWVASVCLLKNHATQTMQFCADAAVQILGGMGYMRGTVSERVYREVKVMMIGGGAEEIMKELAARQLGI
ncbi:acyl-CoA dehydrogenase family protein [Hydrogenophaga sp. SL48]|uniref:acyl-CoA dehydrogenase family protein n=1 Tax=Hydrogenophaga sp. SL48 TaxID=2806347 RepID=UPI001F445FCA|nr:acyl-CoA dehydrogenase family protein [Hydrogenophaga sp. SL48]UJW79801.1 acyl-CoA dehydrogenase family protein [Hydrogenophaga sp. SL48]